MSIQITMVAHLGTGVVDTHLVWEGERPMPPEFKQVSRLWDLPMLEREQAAKVLPVMVSQICEIVATLGRDEAHRARLVSKLLEAALESLENSGVLLKGV